MSALCPFLYFEGKDGVLYIFLGFGIPHTPS